MQIVYLGKGQQIKSPFFTKALESVNGPAPSSVPEADMRRQVIAEEWGAAGGELKWKKEDRKQMWMELVRKTCSISQGCLITEV